MRRHSCAMVAQYKDASCTFALIFCDLLSKTKCSQAPQPPRGPRRLNKNTGNKLQRSPEVARKILFFEILANVFACSQAGVVANLPQHLPRPPPQYLGGARSAPPRYSGCCRGKCCGRFATTSAWVHANFLVLLFFPNISICWVLFE